MSYLKVVQSFRPTNTMPLKEEPMRPSFKNFQNGKVLRQRCRRVRTIFTNFQVMELEREFQSCIYLYKPRRIELSTRLGLNENQVRIWFQNRRMKFKNSSIITRDKDFRTDHMIAMARKWMNSKTNSNETNFIAEDLYNVNQKIKTEESSCDVNEMIKMEESSYDVNQMIETKEHLYGFNQSIKTEESSDNFNQTIKTEEFCDLITAIKKEELSD